MPQGDLNNDVKVSCETLAPPVNDNDNDNDNDDSSDGNPVVVVIPPPDYAPESFWLSKDAELDWLDRNAFLERKDSGKGSSQGITSSSNSNLVISSQRYSGNLKSKASLIALPKPQKQNYAEVKHRRHCSRPSSARLFPKRSEPDCPKPVLALSEPGSPKVSCMGRVRSRKDRKNRKKEKKAGLVRVKSIKERKPGFWKNFRSIFRGKRGDTNNNSNKLDSNEDQTGDNDFAAVVRNKSSRLRSNSRKKRGFDSNNSNNNNDESNRCGPSEPPGLGGMKRFVSGRKSDGWAGDLEFDGAKSEPLNPGDVGPIWRRREVGPPVEVEVDRDWRSVGPVSV